MEIAGEHYPVVVSLANYYPFGLQMHGRKYNAENYRFGFNDERAIFYGYGRRRDKFIRLQDVEEKQQGH